METLERMGCRTKWSRWSCRSDTAFNLDGSTLYIARAVTFLAEAYHIDLTWSSELTILATALIASKGSPTFPQADWSRWQRL